MLHEHRIDVVGTGKIQGKAYYHGHRRNRRSKLQIIRVKTRTSRKRHRVNPRLNSNVYQHAEKKTTKHAFTSLT